MSTPTATRQRIDGALHRSLAADVQLRAAEPGQADDGLLRLRLSVSSETPYLRTSWWDDPWIEVLGHKDSEVDLSRYNGGAAVLANHDRSTAVGNTPLAGIGAIERAWIEGGRIMADVVISRRDALADLRQDIQDGLVKHVSVGYMINERTLVRQGAKGEPSEYRVTSWQPFEVSLVDVPADATVGLGRSGPDAQPGYRVIDLGAPPAAAPAAQVPNPPAEGNTEGNRSMNTAAAASAENTATTPPVVQVRDNGADFINQERARVREISALGKQLGLPGELVERSIDNGTTLDAFREIAIKEGIKSGAMRTAESPEIGMSKKELEQFSVCRALLAAHDPQTARQVAPFEFECSRAAQDKRGESRGKDREAAITIPVDVLSRGLSVNAAAAASAARMFVGRAQRGGNEAAAMLRDLVVGTTTAGGHTVATELFGSSFVELLRNAMVLDRLGITMLRDLNGNVAIPTATGTAATYWVAENGAVTESQASFGQVAMTPKTIGALTDYSRRLLLQSSIDVEMFVRMDLAATMGQGIQDGALNGTGSSNQPTGLFNTSGVGAVVMGANGGAASYDMFVDLETAVANANADVGSLAFLTNTKVRGKSRKTQEFSGTNGKAVWTGAVGSNGVGDVLGYSAYVSNSVPSNLTKGSSSGVCSAVAFGNWADLVIGMWGGLDLLLDPYTGSASGTRRVVALQDLDVAVRRLSSFAVSKDVLTT